MTLTFELGIDRVKMNQRAIYLDQRSFSAKVIVPTQTHARTQETDCFTWTTKVADGPRREAGHTEKGEMLRAALDGSVNLVYLVSADNVNLLVLDATLNERACVTAVNRTSTRRAVDRVQSTTARQRPNSTYSIRTGVLADLS